MYAYSRNTSCMFIHVELRLVGLIICMHTSCSVVHVTVDTNLRLISTCIYFRIPPSDPPPLRIPTCVGFDRRKAASDIAAGLSDMLREAVGSM